MKMRSVDGKKSDERTMIRSSPPSSPWWKLLSEVVAQAELDLPGVGLGAGTGDSPKARRPEGRSRIVESHIVEGIEEFDPELDTMVLSNVKVLVKRQVEYSQAGPYNGPGSGVPEGVNLSPLEGTGVEPPVELALFGEMA